MRYTVLDEEIRRLELRGLALVVQQDPGDQRSVPASGSPDAMKDGT